MMIPPKLRHGDNLANLFEKFNTVIDYLREIRLVAGNGIRINRLSAGTTIESTATATGGTQTAPSGEKPHQFDVEIINKGTEENPDYYARVYNSELQNAQTAGWVYVGQYGLTVPTTELKIPSSAYYFVWLVVKYDSTISPPFAVSLKLYQDGVRPPEDGSDTAWCRTIAEVQQPSSVSTFYSSHIEVTGRWC